MAAVTTSRAGRWPIGEMARRSGVHIETIRYYEKIGLLSAPPRTEGGRRVYGVEHQQALSFIRRARELGFPIDDIRTLLALAEPDGATCAEVERIARAHLDGVRARLSDLAKLEAVLARTVRLCAGGTAPICPVIEVLSAAGAETGG